MPDDLHSRLAAALQSRLEVARAATPGPWRRSPDGAGSIVEQEHGDHTVAELFCVEPAHRGFHLADAAHIVASDPSSTIRRIEAQLRVVERHVPEHDGTTGRTQCRWCANLYSLWPCHELRDLATGEGIEVADD